MPYAAASDMVVRFGQAEMLRISAPSDQPLDVIDVDRVGVALADASALIDSYLRRRYLTPVNPAPQEMLRACCILARFDLAQGDAREPSEQMRLARKETIAWLESVRDGKTFLADATPAGAESLPQVTVRQGVAYGGVGPVPPNPPHDSWGWA